MSAATHTCECGFTWQHGLSGAHQCEPHYRRTIAALRASLTAAQQVVAVDERSAYAAAEFASWEPTSMRYLAFCAGCPFCIRWECTLKMAPPALDWGDAPSPQADQQEN